MSDQPTLQEKFATLRGENTGWSYRFDGSNLPRVRTATPRPTCGGRLRTGSATSATTGFGRGKEAVSYRRFPIFAEGEYLGPYMGHPNDPRYVCPCDGCPSESTGEDCEGCPDNPEEE